MTGQWQRHSLGELIRIKHGFAFSGEFFSDEPTESVLLTPGNFAIGGGFKGGKHKYYSGPIPEEYVLLPGSLLVTMTDLSKDMDTLGLPAWSPDLPGINVLHNQRLGLLTAIDPDIDLEFVYYVLCGDDYRNEIKAGSTGSTVHHTSPNRILNYVLNLPTLNEQHAIAGTLGALDDKIDSNRRLAVIASDFIDSLAEAMLIQNRCHTARLSDVVSFNRKSIKPEPLMTPQTYIQYVDIASVSPGDVDAFQSICWKDAPSRARRVAVDGDVIFSTVRPGRRAFALLLDPPANTVISTGFAVMTPGSGIGSSVLTSIVGQQQFADYLESVAHGSAYPAVDIDAMGRYEIELPDDKAVVSEFEARTMPLRRRVAIAKRESTRLAALRDTLLPELLSGRIQVAAS